MARIGFRSLEIFVAAAEGVGVAHAARKLGITPAAASLAISRLENRLGINLLALGPRRSTLTEEGVRLLRAIGDDVRRMQNIIRTLEGEPAKAPTSSNATPAAENKSPNSMQDDVSIVEGKMEFGTTAFRFEDADYPELLAMI